MSIYLDAVWLMNFFFDFMLLLLTDRLAKLSTGRGRLALGAFVASIIVPISVLYPDSFITSFFGKILFSLLIILTSFGFRNLHSFSKILLLFYFMSFSIGGAMIAIHYLLQQPFQVSNGRLLTLSSDFGDPVSWLFVSVGFPLSWIFTKRRMDKHTQDTIRYDALYPVAIQIKDKVSHTNGYIDSGNQLVDPFTKKPIIICDESFLSNWFNREDWEQLKAAYEEWEMDKIPKDWVDDLQIIPYQGVEGKNGFIFAIKPAFIQIEYGDHSIETNNFLVGIQFGELTADGRYHCLLHPELIQTATVYSA